jgi:hypothetical protein
MYRRFCLHFSQLGSGIGLGLFRILYAAVLQAEILQLIDFHDLVYGGAPGDNWGIDNDFTPLLWGWWAAVVLFGLGLWVRPALIVNYIAAVGFMGSFNTYAYHVDFFFLGMNFLLLVFPARTAYSVNWKMGRAPGPPATASWGYTCVLVAVGVGYVYFDSIFMKFDSPMWRAGLGMFTPASLPHNTWINLDLALDQEWLVRGLGYFTLFFETVFIFLLPFQRFRLWLALGGLALHFGICVAFPIPWFALGVAALYVVLIPDSVWAGILGRLRIPLPALAPVPGIEGRERAWVAGLAMAIALTALQALLWVTNPLVTRNLPAALADPLLAARRAIEPTTRQWIGLTRHGVFMDPHFANYNHCITLVHRKGNRETWLPLVRQDGLAGTHKTGRFWVNYTFRTVGAKVNNPRLSEGLRRETWYWATRNGVSLRDAEFIVKLKKVAPAFEWQKDITEKNLAAPWLDVGTVIWKDGQCTVTLPEIEAL